MDGVARGQVQHGGIIRVLQTQFSSFVSVLCFSVPRVGLSSCHLFGQ